MWKLRSKDVAGTAACAKHVRMCHLIVRHVSQSPECVAQGSEAPLGALGHPGRCHCTRPALLRPRHPALSSAVRHCRPFSPVQATFINFSRERLDDASSVIDAPLFRHACQSLKLPLEPDLSREYAGSIRSVPLRPIASRVLMSGCATDITSHCTSPHKKSHLPLVVCLGASADVQHCTSACHIHRH